VTTYSTTDDSKMGYIIYDINADGKMAKMTNYDSNGTVLSTMVYEYDANGKLSSRMNYDASGATVWKYSAAWKHNAKGRLTEWTTYKEDGSVLSDETWKYDSKGREIKDVKTYTNSTDGTSWYRKMTYKAGRLVKTTTYSMDGTITGHSTYQYNSKGLAASETYYDTNGKTGVDKWKYDSKKRLIKSTGMFTDYSYTMILKYDAHGNESKDVYKYTKTDSSYTFTTLYQYEPASGWNPVLVEQL